MPTYETTGPITATIEFDVAKVRIIASERTAATVEVLPSDGGSERDVDTAQQTKVSYAAGKLLVKGPKKRSLFAKVGSVDVTVELPAGSEVQGTLALGDFRGEGPLGECRLKTSAGDIELDQSGAANLRTSHGDISLRLALGDVEVTGGGRVELGRLQGAASVKNSNGDTSVQEVGGPLVAKNSNGKISVGSALGNVEAKTANGAIRLGEVVGGQVVANTSLGEIQVGIREHTAAWVDAGTDFGTVRNSLGTAEGPETAERTVELRLRTGLGDILINRA
ncbi:hypothetical protein C7C46_17575 [Streptomyces tateyamensis]|uniref:DUF4097 domain-containing protein n=1 Tax=Streptomyces tateyamensis TaxID=565073 RepID=A0A2V4NQ96_9ACTN|nr:DUF4097 family beta strand repeat-containing protein [Streptomyces tateyamensis]PYC78135.1 hypothetical protein C7C46_17575 [Streptomyces tateyamensis]